MDRDQRKERIQPFWEDLSDDKEPRTTKPALLQLMQDLKDEGNTLFKETLYDLSWMHYRNALFVARMLETRFYYEVKKDFISTLFSNRALCCLKKELFDQALSDCDSAIRTQPTNVKAFYRKVQALKALGRNEDALEIARTGYSKQPPVFKELLEELETICRGPASAPAPVRQPAPARPAPKKTLEVSINDARPVVKEKVDNEWLQDTNALRVEKQREAAIAKMPKKKKASKPNGVSKPVASQLPISQSSTEESEDDSDGLDEDAKFAKQLQSVRSNKKEKDQPLKITQPKVAKEEEVWAFPHSPDTDVDVLPLSGFKKVGPVGSKSLTAMGLDDFGASKGQSAAKSASSTRISPDRKPVKQAKPAVIEVDWPLKNEFDFQLACKVCFQKIGEGVRGYQYTPLKHTCSKTFLLVRLKDKPTLNWLKIRPRAESQMNRYANYKICQQFNAGQPCRVGEERCTFPHHQPELRLWAMDRDEVFSIAAFIDHLRTIGVDSSLGSVPAPVSMPSAVPQAKPGIPGMNYTNMASQNRPPPQAAPSNTQKPPQRQPLLVTPTSPLRQKPQMKQPPMMPPPPPHSGFGVPMPNFNVPPPQDFHQFGAPPGGYPGQPPSHMTEMFGDGDAGPREKLNNPLGLTHEFKILCKQCMRFDNFPGRYVYTPHQHLCEENMLGMKNKQGGPWFRVRERANHREFPGNYIVCNSVTYSRPDWCHYGEENCSFAHNTVEQRLWTIEKDGGNFSVTEFIIQNRSSSKNKGFSLTDILSRHGGNFDFICRNCYYSQPPRISGNGNNGFCNGMFRHQWQSGRILAHFATDGAVTVMNNRGFLHKTAFFKVCKYLHFCRNNYLGICKFAHSMVERDVWMLERDTEMTRDEIVTDAHAMLFGYAHQPAPETKRPTPPPTGQMRTGMSQPASSTPPPAPGPADCPWNIQTICGTCWKNGTKSLQDGTKDRCSKGHNLWHQIRIFQVQPSLKEIRPLPKKIPANLHFIICKYVREKKKCGYNLGGPCQFAHSEEELEIWKWMCKNSHSTLDELAEASKKAQIARAPKPVISGGESVIAVQKAVARVMAPSDLNFNPHYCQYCGIQCNSEKQWDSHCASEKHTFNVNSDRDHQWNHRQPPWGIPASGYELCAKHVDDERCQYSHVPEMYNLCNYAHSEEELDEWKERYEWRQMKREMAKQQKVFSYMDTLRETYETSESGISVMSEDLEGVTITPPEEPLIVYREDKQASLVWTFLVRSLTPLQKVALLYNRDRLHFSLQSSEGKGQQITHGDAFEDVDAQGKPCFKVEVKFTGGMFGSFSQWVIFDFGKQPVMVRKLSVEVGRRDIHEQVHALRQQLAFDRWTSLNREIIRQGNCAGDPFSEQLLKKYKEPSSSEQVVTQNSIIAELNRNNYVHKMHKLLELEEMTRHRIISSYNLCTEVEILDRIEDKCAIYPRLGELFARVHLSENLTEDTNAGKLILTSVKKVLLAPVANSKKVVFEANIVREDNFNYDGRGKEYLYLCLPPVCVKGLKMAAGKSMELEIQFQMNRLFFCRMHYAIDCVKNTDIVFPDIMHLNPDWETEVFKISSKILNDDQMAAVRHIVAERKGYTPPFIMYGPFGTGKTETLAQAAMVLLRERRETKILICAQSNSAADLYIVKHLDPFLRKSGSHIGLRRIYVKERRVNTVPQVVQQYCLFSGDRSAFEFPSKEDIMRHRIVITTVETSLQLSKLGLQGYFTHIFVDEAAQALECETIMPLSLATEKTCIVLTGDHMQISPKVLSGEAKRLNFHVSLLDRLYQYYERLSSKIQVKLSNPLNIFLSINYRTKMEILRFISAIFYGGPESLKAKGVIPSVVELTPLVFHAVQGREVQDSDSTSYYNSSEVEEIVERVEELYNNWPLEWGEKHPQDIEVVTPYYEQVQLIRYTLRKRRPELRGISVDTIHNVQGKEFRALFISTCRTRHLLESSHIESLLQSSECDGDIGDFGFLSDPKLLNTALTRAKSYVCVVGDPVALCAIGDCVQVWRTYLKHCANMKSFYPQTITYDSIKTKVLDLQMSPLGMKLKEVTEMSRNSSASQRSANVNAVKAKTEDAWKPTVNSEPVQSAPVQPVPQAVPAARTVPAAQTVPTVPTVQPSSQKPPVQKPPPPLQPVSPPKPLQPLATNGFMPPPLKQFTRPAPAPEPSVQQMPAVEVLRQLAMEGSESLQIKNHHVKFTEEDGYAMVSHVLDSSETRKKHARSQETYSDLEGVQGQNNVLIDLDMGELKSLLKSKPDRYFVCILYIKSETDMFARVTDFNSPIHHIKIDSRRNCGLALGNDEVVVEILDHENEIHGRVVGVLKRSIYPDSMQFVCTVDPSTPGILIPLKKNLPRMYNLTTGTHLSQVKTGLIPVYQFTREQKVEFRNYEYVDQADPTSKVFVVRYLKWEQSFYLPFAVVVDSLPAGRSIEMGMQVLDTEYNIQTKYRQETEAEVAALYPGHYQIPELASREDLRSKWCFTIDSPQSKDVNAAVSIEQVDGLYEVALHITDVAYFLQKSSEIDLEARNRGTSFYPLNRSAVHMLPPKLSTELCSILPNTDRLTLSIFMAVNGAGEITRVQLKKSVINNKQKFSYKEAENILLNPEGAQTDYFTSCMVVLYQVALLWRRNRVGNDYLCLSLQGEDKLTPKAHLLMEELMITANQQVAIKLVGAYPESTPLKCQSPMNPQEAEDWKEKHATSAINTVALTKPFLDGNRTCKCRVACTCIFTFIRGRGIQAQGSFDIQKKLWATLCNAADACNYELVQQLIVAPESHPQLYLAEYELARIQERSHFVCSGDEENIDQGHYNLNVQALTSFTHPLTSYMDIVVQRLLSALIDNQQSPYTNDEIQRLAENCNEAGMKSREYHQNVLSLHLASALSQKPLVTQPVVEHVDDKNFALINPALKESVVDDRIIPMIELDPSDKPETSEDPVEVKMRWQERIYDLAGPLEEQTSDRVKELDPDKLVYKVPAFHWQRLLNAIREEDFGKLQSMLVSVREQVDKIVPEGHYATELSSESSKGGINHFVDFTLKIYPSMVMQVQITADVRAALLKPKLQLLKLTPNFDICLEHRTSPGDCFANAPTSNASQSTYRSETEYKQKWLPVLGLESANRAVHSQESVTIHNVNVQWQAIPAAAAYMGTMRLPLTFFKERQIKFMGDLSLEDLLQHGKPTYVQSYFKDFICLRYQGLQISESPGVHPCVSMVANSGESVTWVCHCRIEGLAVEGDQLKFSLELVQSSTAFPDVVLAPQGIICTIEWIPRTPLDRHCDYAVQNLPEASTLAKNIALGRKPADLDDFNDTEGLLRLGTSQLNNPNENQIKALKQALVDPFTVIEGPPGCGKSQTAARLAYLFSLRNRTSSHSAQVMVCGPSNKSVDVITGYLQSMGPNCPRLVRIYSEKKERSEYPLPRDPVAPKKRKTVDLNEDPLIKTVALHELIRQPENTYSQQILEMDTLFGLYQDAVTDDQVDQYVKMLASAAAVEIQQAEIILTTCSASASPKLSWGTNIQQVIIDDCGMCTEPESLIPISVFNSIQHVTLFGDCHQLQPKVSVHAANTLGLGNSLMHRYTNKAISLSTQYRMHKGIAEFPSQYFYGSALACGSSAQLNSAPLQFWPNDNEQPVAFCHVAGVEEVNAMYDKSEMSSCVNDREVQYAVTYATMLVNKYRVRESDIVVLTPQLAQCAAIQKKLQLKGLRKITVCSVLDSQGKEWDYVIYSTVRSLTMAEIERCPSARWIESNLGCLADPHQVNVAITRPRKGLIIIGNKYLLQSDVFWCKLLEYYSQQQKVVEADSFLRLNTNYG